MSALLRLPPALLLVSSCALWGAATVFSRGLLSSIPPIALLVLQLAPSVMLLWLVVWLSGACMPPRKVVLGHALLGLLNPGVSYTLSLMGLALISASVSSLLWAAEPLMIAGLAAMLLAEPVRARLLAVMLAGMAGVALVVGGGMSTAGGVHPAGVLLLLAAVLCCAFYTVFSRKWSDRADPAVAVAIQQSAGLLWAMSLLFADTGHGGPADVAALSWRLIAAAAASGVMYYALAYLLYMTALRNVSAAVAGNYFNVIPLVAVGLAYVFLGETLEPLQIAGAAVILGSVFELVRITGRQAADVGRS